MHEGTGSVSSSGPSSSSASDSMGSESMGSPSASDRDSFDNAMSSGRDTNSNSSSEGGFGGLGVGNPGSYGGQDSVGAPGFDSAYSNDEDDGYNSQANSQDAGNRSESIAKMDSLQSYSSLDGLYSCHHKSTAPEMDEMKCLASHAPSTLQEEKSILETIGDKFSNWGDTITNSLQTNPVSQFATGYFEGGLVGAAPGGFLAAPVVDSVDYPRAFKAGYGLGEATWGLGQMFAGAGGEVLGLGLDATGIGATVGVPVNVVSTATILEGAADVTSGLKVAHSALTDKGSGGLVDKKESVKTKNVDEAVDLDNVDGVEKQISEVKNNGVKVKDPGQKGGWNKELNQQLEPNSKIQAGDYLYEADELGRVKKVSGKLELNTRDRNTYQQQKAGNTDGIKDGLKTDEGGHLIASIFDGPGEQINYAAMNGNLNKGVWKRLENTWAGALKENKSVNVEIELLYEAGTKRPDRFIVTSTIGDVENVSIFRNKPGG